MYVCSLQVFLQKTHTRAFIQPTGSPSRARGSVLSLVLVCSFSLVASLPFPSAAGILIDEVAPVLGQLRRRVTENANPFPALLEETNQL